MFAALATIISDHAHADVPWTLPPLIKHQPGYAGLVLIRPEQQPHDLLCLLFDTDLALRQAVAAIRQVDDAVVLHEIASGTVRYADIARIASGKVAAYADVNGSSFDPDNLPDLALRRRWAALWRRYDGHCGWLNIDRGDGAQYNIAFFASADDAARLDDYRTSQEDIQQFTAAEIAPRSRGELVPLGRGAVRWCDVRNVTPLT